MAATSNSQRTFTVLVDDLPGVLNRVASLFRRRCYNIASLTVGRTHRPGISRMTIVAEADARAGQLIAANLNKLINVRQVEDITEQASLARAVALIRVECGAARRPEVLQLCAVFRARAVDVATSWMIVEVAGSQSKIDRLVTLLSAYGVSEMVQTGTIAMARRPCTAARTPLLGTEEQAVGSSYVQSNATATEATAYTVRPSDAGSAPTRSSEETLETGL